MLVFQNDRIKTVLLGYVERKTEAIQRGLGYKKFFSIPVKCLHIVAGGCYVGLNTHELKAVYEYLLSTLKTDFDVIQLDSFSSTYAMRKLYRKNVFKNTLINRNTQCQIDVSDSYEAFYNRRSKNTRKKLRRRERDIFDRYDEKDVSVRFYTKPGDLDTALNDIEDVSVKTYQRKMSVGFKKDTETRRIFHKMASRNHLLLSVLYIEGVPRAFETGIIQQNTHFALTTGYDPQFADLSIGHFLFIKIIQHLFTLDHISIYNFGIGESFYKNQLSDGKLTIFQAKIFARSAKGILSFYMSKANICLKKMVGFTKKLLGKPIHSDHADR